MQHNKGFTLIELMVAVAILAILATIGYNSYTRYIAQNAERQAEAKMQSLSMELDRYRSSRLTYKGFVPKKINADKTETYAFEDGSKTVYSSDGRNKYIIELTDSNNNPMSAATGGKWVMFAKPADTAMKELKYKYFMSSTGQRCRSVNAKFDKTTTCTEAGVEIW